MEEKSLIKVEESIFVKIKNLFKNLFKKKVIVEPKIRENSIANDKGSFKQNIIVEEDKEKVRLLKLQDEFEKGNIAEEDITEGDIEKLHELYDEQIEAINKETEMYKKRILEIKAKLNKTA